MKKLLMCNLKFYIIIIIIEISEPLATWWKTVQDL